MRPYDDPYAPLTGVLDPDPEVIVEQHPAVFVAIGGLKESGKDTLANALVDRYGFRKLGMSDPLHQAMILLDPIVYPGSATLGDGALTYVDVIEAVGYDEAKRQYPEVRRLLQKMGTDVMRNLVDPDTWVRIMRGTVEPLLGGGTSVVLTGVRFHNELEALREMGALTVWIDRPGLPFDPHSSENLVHVEDFEIEIKNSGSRNLLEQRSWEIVELARSRHRHLRT